jgi:hypothetical protein
VAQRSTFSGGTHRFCAGRVASVPVDSRQTGIHESLDIHEGPASGLVAKVEEELHSAFLVEVLGEMKAFRQPFSQEVCLILGLLICTGEAFSEVHRLGYILIHAVQFLLGPNLSPFQGNQSQLALEIGNDLLKASVT